MGALRRTVLLLTVVTVGAAAAGCARTFEDYLARADAFARANRPREAILEYRNALTRNPTYGPGYLRLGDQLMQVEDVHNAALVYIKASQLLPNDLTAQLRAGNMLLLGKMYKEAQGCARRVLTMDPKNIPAQVLNANALAGLKRYDSAMAAIERAIALDPTRGGTYTDLGALQLTMHPDEAEANFKRAVELNPTSVDARVTLASLYWAEGRASESEAELRRAHAIEPASVVVNRALATFYLSTNRAREAEGHLRAVVKASPTTPVKLVLADYLIATGRTADATTVLQDIEKARDGFGEARSRLATLRYQANQKDEAHRLIEDGLKTDSAHPRLILAQAQFNYLDGRLDLATERAQAALRADTQNLPARYLLASISMARQNLEEAARQYVDILRVNPKSVAAKMELANIRLTQGDASKAREYADEAARDRPRSIDAQVFLLRALISKGETARASALLAPLLKLAPERADVQWLSGNLRLLAQDKAGARAAFERALRMQPDALEAVDGLVAIELAAGNTPRATAVVEAALARQPKSPRLLLLAARLYLTVQDPVRAEGLLRTAIDVAPGDPALYEMLARAFASQKKFDQAVKEFEALAARSPKAVGPPTMIATILEAQNRPFEAMAWYEKALAADSRAVVAANNLAWLYAEQGGDLEQALRLARIAQQQLPEHLPVNDTLGWVLYKMDNVGQAIPLLQMCAERDPKNPIYRYHLGLAYARSGNTELARESLRAALDLRPGFPGAANARSVLSTLR